MNSRGVITSEREARCYVEGLGDRQALERLDRYANHLIEENQRQNLISKPSEQHLWVRHLADSAQLLDHLPSDAEKRPIGPWLDLGTGPGLPGMVIAILRPDIPMVLVESRAKRVEFLERCVADLGLANCDIRGDRLERIEPFKAWVISARAFAPLDKLLRLSAPFSTKQTHYLLPKGRSAAHELDATKQSIRTMFHVKHSLTDADAGIIVSK